jgi:hypothetical protein
MYINDKLIDDYISGIDGYLHCEETHKKSDEVVMKGNIEKGIPISGGSGNIENISNNEINKKVKITDAAKFQRVYEYLEENKELKFIEAIDEGQWNKLRRDDFIEILVDIRFSKLTETINVARQFGEMAKTFESFIDNKVIDKKASEAINGLGALEKLSISGGLSCVLTADDSKKYPLIAYLDKEYLKQNTEKFNGKFYIFCRIQNKIEKGKKILLDELFEDVKKLPLNRNQRRNMPKNLNNPNQIRDEVRGPATVVMPLAIYR